MTAEKAIQIFELNLMHPGSHMPPDIKDALQLGLEALQRHDTRLQRTWNALMTSLPSETPISPKES